MPEPPDGATMWRWATVFLAGIVVSVVAFWMVEARHYVTRAEVEEVVERVMGRAEIMSQLGRIYQASSEARTRLRSLEDAVTRLETVLEEARR